MAELNITERQAGDVTVLDLGGKITIGEGSVALRSAIKRLIEEGKKKILLNLGKVSYVDSSGIGELVSSFTTINREGGQLKLLNLSQKIQDLMTITKLHTVFDVYDDETAALNSFKSGSGGGEQGLGKFGSTKPPTPNPCSPFVMFRAAFRRLLAVDDPPERTALAFSVGIFIAFSPFLGLHTIMATVAAFAFRFNKIAIYTGTFVNNPFLTLVPITVASYAVGALLLGRPVSLPEGALELLSHPRLLTGAYWRQLLEHLWDVVLPFSVGGTVLSVVCSLAAYPVTLRLLRARKNKGMRDEG